MSWCDRCLSNHDGPCLEERKRLEVQLQLAAYRGDGTESCPFCGGRGSGGPYGYRAAARTCTFCSGSGRAAQA
jgi:hypothetical protein